MGRKLSKIVKSAAKIVGTSLLAASLLAGPTLAKEKCRSPKKKCGDSVIDLFAYILPNGMSFHFNAKDTNCDGNLDEVSAHRMVKFSKNEDIYAYEVNPLAVWRIKYERKTYFDFKDGVLDLKCDGMNGNEISLLTPDKFGFSALKLGRKIKIINYPEFPANPPDKFYPVYIQIRSNKESYVFCGKDQEGDGELKFLKAFRILHSSRIHGRSHVLCEDSPCAYWEDKDNNNFFTPSEGVFSKKGNEDSFLKSFAFPRRYDPIKH